MMLGDRMALRFAGLRGESSEALAEIILCSMYCHCYVCT